MRVTRVAAVDCGTNSVRLLVADISGDELTDVLRRMEITRLGQGVDRTGRLASDALERTLAVIREYADQIRSAGAERVRMVATSASRDAANSAEFVDPVRDLLGAQPEVVSGDEEAALSFAGATRELRSSLLEAPYLVVDIGGGSTEFVLGTDSVQAARSVDIGCVRLTERHLHSDPPKPVEVEAVRADVWGAVGEVATTVPLSRARTLVGLAGTVTTVAGIALNLPAYDAAQIHHSRISAIMVHEVAEALLHMHHDQRAAIPVMHPGRVDVITAGAIVLDEIVRRVGCREIVASEHDILDGIAWSLA